MFRASMPYGRKGMPVATISVVDLALWDLARQAPRRAGLQPDRRQVPRRDRASTAPARRPRRRRSSASGAARCRCRYGHFDGADGLREERRVPRRAPRGGRAGYPADGRLLHVARPSPYAIALAEACKPLGIYWREEALHPDDVEGFRLLKEAHPTIKLDHRRARIHPLRLPPADRGAHHRHPAARRDVGRRPHRRCCSIAAQAAAYDIPVVPHGSGPYSYHFIASQPAQSLCEYVAASPDGRSIRPIFGKLFTGEDLPQNGRLKVSSAPGFGMEIADRSLLKPFA